MSGYGNVPKPALPNQPKNKTYSGVEQGEQLRAVQLKMSRRSVVQAFWQSGNDVVIQRLP